MAKKKKPLASAKYGVVEQKIKVRLRERIRPLVMATIRTYREYSKIQIQAWLNSGFNNAAINTMLERGLAGTSRQAMDALDAFQKQLTIVMSEQVDEIYRAENGWDDNTLLMWVGEDDERTCPDCLPRINSEEVKTLKEWESIGTPRSGWSVCGEHCRCDLVEPD